MLKGETSETQNLYGTLTAAPPMTGVISGRSSLTGKVSVAVRDVPYWETSNCAGGITVYIGKEVTQNGCN